MIVVPTEKQFDWRHAPVVLFFIVLINVFTYFFYQSGDTGKYIQAFGQYHEGGFFQQEWPLLQTYLQQRNETQTLQDLQQNYAQEEHQQIVQYILLRHDFYEHLAAYATTDFTPDEREHWQTLRPRIQQAFDSVSAVAHGLIANRFSISALLTYQFLHGGIMHLLGNMFFLVICGFAVEAAVGHWRFLAFYLLGGIAAGMAQVVANWQSAIPLVGASGSISAVMAMYLAVFRLRKIEFFYWIFFLVGYFRAPALWILPLYIGKELYSYHTAADSNVAFLAHAGGFVAGGVLIGISMLFDKNTINLDYVEGEQNAVDEHRQALAEIYAALEKYRFSQAYKLVNDAIKNFGESFELALIRFNLLKIGKGKGYAQSILRLWQLPRLLPHELERLAILWQEHPELHTQLNDTQAIDLGIQFASLSNPDAAEQIFTMLSQRQCQAQAFGVLAQKLAVAFGKLEQPHKQAKYTQASAAILQGGRHGVL